MSREDYLFSNYDLHKVTANVEQKMCAEIDGLPEAQLLGAAPDDLARYFAEKYQLESPELHDDKITVDSIEFVILVATSGIAADRFTCRRQSFATTSRTRARAICSAARAIRFP